MRVIDYRRYEWELARYYGQKEATRNATNRKKREDRARQKREDAERTRLDQQRAPVGEGSAS